MVTGIEMTHTGPALRLAPITSKGRPSKSCLIDIDADPATLRYLAERLNDLADSIESLEQ